MTIPVVPKDSGKNVARQLGETEVSYYLPSRENGVNDMYLHLGFRAPVDLVTSSRVRLIWAILRQRHPLLAAKVRMNGYEDITFEYQPIQIVDDSIAEAETALEFRTQNKDDLIDSYLNGPRTLSNDRLSYLFISSPEGQSDDAETEHNWMLCTTHYIGDGMALHATANDFFTLLGNDNDEAKLRALLHSELTSNKPDGAESQLPLSIEARLPKTPNARIFEAMATVDHLLSQRKLIGGHAFPRRSGKERKTVVPTVPFDSDKTKNILKKCKANGVSISSAIFALCNIAWARTHKIGREEPMMMYSALNLRPYVPANERLNNSYWFLAIGYFNIVLPTFYPPNSTEAAIFWHRARSVKTQTAKAAKSPMLVSRSHAMAKERGLRSRIWGMQDDGVECTLKMPKQILFEDDKPAPSKALIGLSMLGNLDGTYKHATFPLVTLHTLTSGSRQRQGGMLLFGYTFVGKLWLSLGYDMNGFDDEVVQGFWKHLLAAVDELLSN
ncbi:hypothetical protein FA15DRAFT_662997 [Coprinopsis marcescibilis]|uniref:CoA-dependent acyltransferase n=1 Tax=Coprinopsis marcescibilis TaxID=230819 RepID=A0A5C3LDP5_COPMA|nr:hypothetical protein FA15DRAFT_662997 [Coprinopsis marcescibilis]